jgi:hypothetical protein
MDEIEMERKVIHDDSPEARFYKEVHSLCGRRLKEGVAADQVVVALLYNAFRGLMERYGIPEARKMMEEYVCWYFDLAERDPPASSGASAQMFSSWRYQTEDEQRRIYNDLGFGEFQEIEECHPGKKEDMIDITLVPAGSAQRRCCTVCGGLTEKWVGVLAQSDDGICVCENCLKAGDIDGRLEQHVQDLKAYVQKMRGLIGRLQNSGL